MKREPRERYEAWVTLKIFKTSVGERHKSVSHSTFQTRASETRKELIRNSSLYESGSLTPRGQHLGLPPPPDQLHPESQHLSLLVSHCANFKGLFEN